MLKPVNELSFSVLINNQSMSLSILWRIMEIEEGVIRRKTESRIQWLF